MRRGYTSTAPGHPVGVRLLSPRQMPSLARGRLLTPRTSPRERARVRAYFLKVTYSPHPDLSPSYVRQTTRTDAERVYFYRAWTSGWCKTSLTAANAFPRPRQITNSSHIAAGEGQGEGVLLEGYILTSP